MQSYKNIQYSDVLLEGYELAQPEFIYQSYGKWYVQCHHYIYKKHFPLVHDTIFHDTAHISYSKRDDALKSSFHPISQSTATVLLRYTGFSSLDVIAQEIKDKPYKVAFHLPHAQKFKVKAKFDELSPEQESALVTITEAPQPSSFWRALSYADFIFIDIPGSVAYNVAIPFMAPYYFFKNIAADAKQDPFSQ